MSTEHHWYSWWSTNLRAPSLAAWGVETYPFRSFFVGLRFSNSRRLKWHETTTYGRLTVFFPHVMLILDYSHLFGCNETTQQKTQRPGFKWDQVGYGHWEFQGPGDVFITAGLYYACINDCLLTHPDITGDTHVPVPGVERQCRVFDLGGGTLVWCGRGTAGTQGPHGFP